MEEWRLAKLIVIDKLKINQGSKNHVQFLLGHLKKDFVTKERAWTGTFK